jgi:hypothetical protein
LPFFLLSNQIHLICPSFILKIYSEFEPPPKSIGFLLLYSYIFKQLYRSIQINLC